MLFTILPASVHLNRCRKAFENFNIFFMIETLNKLTTDRSKLNIIKTIYDQFTPNNILRGKKLEAFLVRSERSLSCPFSSVSLNILLEVLARVIRQEKNKIHRPEMKK